MDPDLKQITAKFQINGTVQSVVPYGSGHINDTYKVTLKHQTKTELILQRINHFVFKEPDKLMQNVKRVTEHIKKKIEAAGTNDQTRYLYFIDTRDGRPCYKDCNNNYWRLCNFISNTVSYDLVTDSRVASAGGKLFGNFQNMLTDLKGATLHETIPDFHNVAHRLQQFRTAVSNDPLKRCSEIKAEIDFVEKRSAEMMQIIELGQKRLLPVRITHNDAKFNNILFDAETGKALCIIDLDTVMPGYILYDFGDAIRTAANTGAEDDTDLGRVGINMKLFKAFTSGYLSTARQFITKTELNYLAFAAKLFAYIIGLRFLTDYINGDKYFKTAHRGHNLQRTRAQFKLLSSMEANFNEMNAIVQTVYSS